KKAINKNNDIPEAQKQISDRINFKRAVVAFLPFAFLTITGIVYAIRNNYLEHTLPDFSPKNDSIYIKPQAIAAYVLLLCSIYSLTLLKNNTKRLLIFGYLKAGWKGIREVFILIITAQMFIISLKAAYGETAIGNLISHGGLREILSAIGLTLLLAFL